MEPINYDKIKPLTSTKPVDTGFKTEAFQKAFPHKGSYTPNVARMLSYKRQQDAELGVACCFALFVHLIGVFLLAAVLDFFVPDSDFWASFGFVFVGWLLLMLFGPRR